MYVSVFPSEWFYRNIIIVHIFGLYFLGQLGAGTIAGIAIGSTIGFCFTVLLILVFPCGCILRRLWRYLHPNKEIMPGTCTFVPIYCHNVCYLQISQLPHSLTLGA
jgi:hypothetical protein